VTPAAPVLVTGAPGHEHDATRLAEELGLPVLVAGGAAPPGALLLAITDDGLELRDADEPSARGVRVDLRDIAGRPDRANVSRRHPLARAVGRRSRTVLDATAGLGHDAALLALIGYEVTAVERCPALAALLRDGVARAVGGGADETGLDPRAAAALRERLTVRAGDARDVLRAGGPPPDAVYVDPMYPPRRKASALARRPIRLVRRLVGDDDDAAELVAAARAAGVRRVAVKRPRDAGPIVPGPVAAVDATLVRYDVYGPAA
jgi:16S rRNA (guanine1516-N2)-methyltransferase